jgi:hypothetical protein
VVAGSEKEGDLFADSRVQSPHQRCLPDPRLATDEDQATSTGERGLYHPGEHPELVLALEKVLQRRAANDGVARSTGPRGHPRRAAGGSPLPRRNKNRVGDPVKSLESSANTHSGLSVNTLFEAESII